DTISSFLFSEWKSGALLGGAPEEAFFVRCDRSTMDQNDLDNGRLVCLIGLAVVKPAEFVIFRIGQKTADARNQRGAMARDVRYPSFNYTVNFDGQEVFGGFSDVSGIMTELTVAEYRN